MQYPHILIYILKHSSAFIMLGGEIDQISTNTEGLTTEFQVFILWYGIE